jgi:hypothetical protein
MKLIMPSRGRGRPSAGALEVYKRGWSYILEEHGLEKGEFDVAQKLINYRRKKGLLPLDICCEDDGRAAEHLEDIDNQAPSVFTVGWFKYLRDHAHEQYAPVSFWEAQDVYLEMTVEKIDLKLLFSSVCKPYPLRLTNISGRNDINSRAAIMSRFKYWEAHGKPIGLLHCGDHDPGGLHISDFLRSNMQDLSDAVGRRTQSSISHRSSRWQQRRAVERCGHAPLKHPKTFYSSVAAEDGLSVPNFIPGPFTEFASQGVKYQA